MQILGLNYWIFLGVLFFILEIISGKFYALCIGLASISIGILTWSRILCNTRIEVALFIVISIIGIAIFRNRLYKMYHSKNTKTEAILQKNEFGLSDTQPENEV